MVMNGCDRFMTPYAELPLEEQARIDLAKAQIMDEARKAVWEGSMSESKAKYYAKHLEQQEWRKEAQEYMDKYQREREAMGTVIGSVGNTTYAYVEGTETSDGRIRSHTPPEQPVSLPTLLAKMVDEYTKELCLHISSDISGSMVVEFNRTLLSCAQPLLAEYLNKLADPPDVVKKSTPTDYIKAEQAMEMARAGYPDLARKHLGLDEEDKQLAYREFCARLALASPDAPTPSLEEWEAARKRVVPMSQQERIEIERGKRR